MVMACACKAVTASGPVCPDVHSLRIDTGPAAIQIETDSLSHKDIRRGSFFLMQRYILSGHPEAHIAKFKPCFKPDITSSSGTFQTVGNVEHVGHPPRKCTQTAHMIARCVLIEPPNMTVQIERALFLARCHRFCRIYKPVVHLDEVLHLLGLLPTSCFSMLDKLASERNLLAHSKSVALVIAVYNIPVSSRNYVDASLPFGESAWQ